MLGRIKRAIAAQLNDKTFLKLKYLYHFGRLPNTRNPATFNEHILVYKLSSQGNANFCRMVDKIEAKRYVAEKVGVEHIIPTLWHGDALPPRAERNWPKPYVLKASHGWAQNVFVRSKSDENWDDIEAKARAWLRSVHGVDHREWVYARLPRRLLVEPYIGDGDVVPVDYKLFVFHGSVKVIQVHTGRTTDHRSDTFDPQWRKLDFVLGYPNSDQDIPRPVNLARMIEIAEQLGEGLPFVRCDLYDFKGNVYFGELTFFPDAGMGVFSPPDADLTVGAMWAKESAE